MPMQRPPFFARPVITALRKATIDKQLEAHALARFPAGVRLCERERMCCP